MNSLMRAMQWVASTPPVTWLYLNVFPLLDKPLLRLTRGRLSVSVGQPVLLLTTIGAKSGQERSTPLLYIEHGDDVLLIASNGGSPRHPAWYHNLRANPQATLTFGGKSEVYVAREAQGDERVELWKVARETYLGFERYQHRAAGRRVPVMILSREGG